MIEVRIVEFRISKLFEILFDLPSSINLPLKREREIPSQIYWLINTVDGEIFDLPDTRLQRQRRNRKPIYMISIQFDSNFPPEIFHSLPSWAKVARVSLALWDLQLPFATFEQIKKVILRIRMDNTEVKKRKYGGEGGEEEGRPNFVSRQRRRYSLAHLQVQPSLRVWVSVNSGYEPTECSSGSSSCRWGSRNWRSSLVKILTLGGKLRAVASRKELQLNSQENGGTSKERCEAGRRAWIINQDS